MFSHQKDGYNQKEVETKINDLLSELTNLHRAMEEKDKLNIGLANALKKSKEIEASSQNLYELKIQKMRCNSLSQSIPAHIWPPQGRRSL